MCPVSTSGPHHLEPLEDHEDLVVTPKPSPNRFIYLDRRLDRLLQQTGFPREGVQSSPEQKRNSMMDANSAFMITEADQRFPVRIRIGVPSDGLGSRLDRIKSWLDENCGASGWAMTPSGTRGVVNDALSIYFGDATLASNFVAHWCAGSKTETAGGVFRVLEDEPQPVGATLH